MAEGHDDEDRCFDATDDYAENFENVETFEDYIEAYEKINDMEI